MAVLEQFVWVGPVIAFVLVLSWPRRERHYRWRNRRFMRRYRASLRGSRG